MVGIYCRIGVFGFFLVEVILVSIVSAPDGMCGWFGCHLSIHCYTV